MEGVLEIAIAGKPRSCRKRSDNRFVISQQLFILQATTPHSVAHRLIPKNSASAGTPRERSPRLNAVTLSSMYRVDKQVMKSPDRPDDTRQKIDRELRRIQDALCMNFLQGILSALQNCLKSPKQSLSTHNRARHQATSCLCSQLIHRALACLRLS